MDSSHRQKIVEKLTSQSARGGMLLLVGNGLIFALGLIRLPVVTWLLPREQLGMIGVVTAWVPFVQLVSMPGLDSAAYFYMAKSKADALFLNLRARSKWVLAGASVFLIPAGWYWFQNEENSSTIATLFIIAAVTFPAIFGFTVSASWVGATERFKGLLTYRLIQAVSKYFGVVPLLFFTILPTSVIWFFAANQIGLAILLTGFLLWTIFQIRKHPSEMMGDSEKDHMVTYGRQQTGLSVLSVVQNRFDVLLVSWFMPLAVVADYLLAQIVYSQVKGLWSVYYTIRFPHLVNMEDEFRRKRLITEISILTFMFAGFALAVGLVYGLAIGWVFPQEYEGSTKYVYWLCFIFSVGVPGFGAETYFRSTTNQSAQSTMRLVAALTNVVVSISLVWWWSDIGILIGRLSSNIALSITGTILFFKRYDTVPMQ